MKISNGKRFVVNLFASATTLLLLMQPAFADLKLFNDVVSQPARIEIHDLDNPSAIKRFYLGQGESKLVGITGLKCKVKVFAKGSDALMVEGEFTPNQNLSIQASGSRWILKRVSR